MPDSPMTEAHKRALVVAYYLSKFERKGVRELGFAPYCSHVWVGWYAR